MHAACEVDRLAIGRPAELANAPVQGPAEPIDLSRGLPVGKLDHPNLGVGR